MREYEPDHTDYGAQALANELAEKVRAGELAIGDIPRHMVCEYSATDEAAESMKRQVKQLAEHMRRSKRGHTDLKGNTGKSGKTMMARADAKFAPPGRIPPEES